MSHSPDVSYVELRVPEATSEREFLQLAVQVAVKKFREMQGKLAGHTQTPCSDTITLPQQVGS